jgi:hypothetical protein
MSEIPIPFKKADKAPIRHARRTSALRGIKRSARKRATLEAEDIAEKQISNISMAEFRRSSQHLTEVLHNAPLACLCSSARARASEYRLPDPGRLVKENFLSPAFGRGRSVCNCLENLE